MLPKAFKYLVLTRAHFRDLPNLQTLYLDDSKHHWPTLPLSSRALTVMILKNAADLRGEISSCDATTQMEEKVVTDSCQIIGCCGKIKTANPTS